MPSATNPSGSVNSGRNDTAPETSGTGNSGGREYSRGLARAIAVAAGVVVVDQLTKWWALQSLSTGPCATADSCIDLVAGVRLRLVFNTGAAFTTGSGYGPLLAVLAMVMTVVLLAMSARRPDRLGAVLLATIAGGAVGNLIDRVFRADDGLFSGAVIDFIDLGWWPVFNLADSAIVVGTVAVILLTFVQDRSDGERRHPSDRGISGTGGPNAEPAADVEPDVDVDVESDADSIPGDPVG